MAHYRIDFDKKPSGEIVYPVSMDETRPITYGDTYVIVEADRRVGAPVPNLDRAVKRARLDAARTLDGARDAAMAIVADRRWRVETQAPVEITLENEATVQILADDRTTSKVSQAVSVAQDFEDANGVGSWSTRWKGVDSFVTIKLSDLRHIRQSLAAHVQAAFNRESTIKDLIDAATTPVDVVAVLDAEIKTGWPQGAALPAP